MLQQCRILLWKVSLNMVFNIEQMNKDNIFEKLMKELKGQGFWFLDQYFMNKVFFGRVTFLPL